MVTSDVVARSRRTPSGTSDDGAGSAIPADGLRVGTLGRPHGVAGEVRVRPESGDPERLLGLRDAWLVKDGRGMLPVAIAHARRHGEATLLVLEGLASREAVAEWTGAELWARRRDLPATDDLEFLPEDVIGAELYDEDRCVGPITGVASANGRDYLEVDHAGRKVLVPAAKDWLVRRDPAARRIVMRLPQGLLDI